MTWKRSEIRQARQTQLKPVLERLGYKLRPAGDDNYRVILPKPPAEIIIKHNYWRRPDTGQAGNAIDFFVKLLGFSFNKAMELLTS